MGTTLRSGAWALLCRIFPEFNSKPCVGIQKGKVIIWLLHSSAVDASQTKIIALIASLMGRFWERMRTPELVCEMMNWPNSVGMVLRSCVTKTLPSRAARVKTSGSFIPSSPASLADWKSRLGCLRIAPVTIACLRSASEKKANFCHAALYFWAWAAFNFW